MSWQPLSPTWWSNHKMYICHQVIIEHHRISTNRGNSLIPSSLYSYHPFPQHAKLKEATQAKNNSSVTSQQKKQIKGPAAQLSEITANTQEVTKVSKVSQTFTRLRTNEGFLVCVPQTHACCLNVTACKNIFYLRGKQLYCFGEDTRWLSITSKGSGKGGNGDSY